MRVTLRVRTLDWMTGQMSDVNARLGAIASQFSVTGITLHIDDKLFRRFPPYSGEKVGRASDGTKSRPRGV